MRRAAPKSFFPFKWPPRSSSLSSTASAGMKRRKKNRPSHLGPAFCSSDYSTVVIAARGQVRSGHTDAAHAKVRTKGKKAIPQSNYRLSLLWPSATLLCFPPPFHFCSKHSTGSKTPRLTIYFGTMKLSSASRRVARLMCFQRMLFLAWLICRFKQNRKDQNGRRNKKKNTAETKQMHNSSSVWPLVFQL